MRLGPLLTLLLLPVVLAGCGSSQPAVGAAACAWHAQRSTDTHDDLVGVSFPDTTHGWVVGGINRPAIEATSDGGARWRNERVGGQNGLADVSFPDRRHGWAVGVHNLLIATDDGGAHWRTEDPRITHGENLYGVAFVDARHGWVVGAAGNIRMTSDGGRTWAPESARTSEDLQKVGFEDTRNGWIVGSGRFWQTHDGGRTWAQAYSGKGGFQNEEIADATFVDPSHGWIVGSESDAGANHSVSTQTVNGGASWERRVLSSPDDIRFNAVAFSGLQDGWVGTYQGDLLYTDSGGRSWAARNDPAAGEQIYGMTFRDARHGWAVGASGTIMACTA